MNDFTSNIRQFEIQEARKRMGLSQGASNSHGMTSGIGNTPNLNNSISVNNYEIQKVKQNMNQNQNMF